MHQLLSYCNPFFLYERSFSVTRGDANILRHSGLLKQQGERYNIQSEKKIKIKRGISRSTGKGKVNNKIYKYKHNQVL